MGQSDKIRRIWQNSKFLSLVLVSDEDVLVLRLCLLLYNKHFAITWCAESVKVSPVRNNISPLLGVFTSNE